MAVVGHRTPDRGRAQLRQHRPVAIDVEVEAHPSAVQFPGHLERQFGRLLPREAPHLHQPWDQMFGPVWDRPEQLQVDPQWNGVHGAARRRGHRFELGSGVAAGHHDPVDAAHQDPVEQPDADLGGGVQPGPHRHLVVQAFV